MSHYLRLALLTLGTACYSFASARPQTETVLYSFKGASDGSYPVAGLIADSKGNGYGTTAAGGGSSNCSGGCGIVYKVNASGVTILHAFAGSPNDGAGPSGGLVMDKSGNLYGTTDTGGTNDYGTVFKITPSGTETILWDFGPLDSGDGIAPIGGLAIDGQDNLYGTTSLGGAFGAGILFRVTPSGKETILRNFRGAPDGEYPAATPTIENGSLYGTTELGGSRGVYGTVWELSSSGTETLLHSFGGEGDGQSPAAPVTFDANGNLYGTTPVGGAYGAGTVFSVATTTKAEKVIYSFGSVANDGNGPYAGVIFDSSGNLYGTTSMGGAFNAGIVYALTSSGTETILHSFGATGDGSVPYSGLIRDSKGNLYGTTSGGGKYGMGTIFKVTP
jgi:uncharacterized repeat protein (TIGR03803 family)